jgi:conjugative relaxase-like TrwC/TraI family protein
LHPLDASCQIGRSRALPTVLSIGKVGLARDQQLYYEQKVARGAEDYYAGRGEAPGRWAGSGADRLGLSGELGAEQLKAMMDGRHPVSGERLAVRGTRSKTAAFDLTFSAPKSVSVLFAVGDERLSRALVEAHEEAVAAALGYLEREACRVRRGHNGTRAEPAGGFVAAAYRHRMSRAQDPQLHTHVVCANMAAGRDGRWTALDGRAIYAHAKAAGCVYEAHLRHAVRQRVPWASWGIVREGIAELEHLPAAVREEFSQRRRRILERERELEETGVAVGFAGRERIVFDTREPKRDIAESDWHEQVRARAAEHGLGRRELDRLAALPAASAKPAVAEDRLAARLFSSCGLTATQTMFRERELVIALAAEHRQGARFQELLRLAEQLLERPEVVPVGFGAHRRYTTRELLQAEELIVRHAGQGCGRGLGVLDERRLGVALKRVAQPLSAEQRAVVWAIARSGNRIDTVEALAGTGKTTSAAVLRELYEEAGYHVLGAAPTARAVRELKERAGIAESRTLDAWAIKLAADPHALESRAPGGLTGARQPAIMVIDEAGMAHTRVSAVVIERAMAANVKVIAIGDSGQLCSVQAGGWLGALTRRLGSHELREVMRQRDPRERRALAKVHRGQPESYLKLKLERGELHEFAGREPGLEAEQALVGRWAAAHECYGPTEAVMVCRDNARRARLNELARARLREQGKLDEDVELGGRRWAVGDRVIARRNDRSRNLDNGMRATITVIDPNACATVRLDSGEPRRLDVDYLSRHVEHAYALTAHGLQGGTVEWAGVIGHANDFTRRWSYTALSRAREPAEIFLVDEPTAAEQEREEIAPAQHHIPAQDRLDRLAARMRERDDEELALEHAERQPDQHLDHRDHPARTADEGVGAAPARDNVAVAPAASALRARLYELGEQLRAVNIQLHDPAIDAAKTIRSLDETIEAIEREHERDNKPRGWRDRGPHRVRQRQREQHLSELREQQDRLRDDAPDPHALLEHADELRDEQRSLATEHQQLRRQAIEQELAVRQPWLEETLGPEPQDWHQCERWHRTARQIAGHRIDHHIAEAHTALSPHVRDHALQRAITDTRAALGLEPVGHGRDAGLGY